MSYDLELYVQREADRVELVALVEQLKGLAVATDEGSSLTVVRGASQSYCFTIDGPYKLDPEDIPEQVTAAVFSPTHLYTVSVEGSAEASVPHAIRFAKKVVTELGGTVFDKQADGVWSRGASRTAPRPFREARVETVNLHWYAPHQNVKPSFATNYLALCRKYLPEALPRRFGGYEPFQGKLAVDGDAGFVSGWESEDLLYFFAGSIPCLGGSMPGGADAYPRAMWWMSLSFLAEPLKDSRWQDAARRLFVALADEVGAVYASAEVLSGAIWSGRSLAYDGQSEMAALPSQRGGWLGLPPYPVWWAYYGEAYRHVVADEFVISNQTTRHGVFHSRSEDPLGRNELLAPLKTGIFRRRSAPWVDPDLVATFAPNERGFMSPPLNGAVHIPSELIDS